MDNLRNKLFSTDNRPNHRSGTSLIEIMVFIVVISVAVIGTSSYRYFSILDIRRSDTEITAGRIASQLCESWKGMGGGVSSYDPLIDSGLGLAIESASIALATQAPPNFTLLKNGGYYKVVSDNRTYYVTMSYHTINDINGNLQTLNVIITWPANLSNNDVTTSKSFCLSELLIIH